MIFWSVNAAAIVAAYLLGSIPTAYIAGRLLLGIDIRQHGSRSVGATNALRVLGKWPALVVLLVDVLKGVIAVAVAREASVMPLEAPSASFDLLAWTPWAASLAGLAAVLGHGCSVWLDFSGGKSVATGLGVVLAISWPVAIGALAAFGLIVATVRIVSLGSILAALTAMALVSYLDQPLPFRLLVIAGGLYVVGRHRLNIRRIAAGTEPRLGRG